MIRSHILSDHKPGTPADSGTAKLTFFPSFQTFPRKIVYNVAIQKAGQYTPTALVNIRDQFIKM